MAGATYLPTKKLLAHRKSQPRVASGTKSRSREDNRRSRTISKKSETALLKIELEEDAMDVGGNKSRRGWQAKKLTASKGAPNCSTSILTLMAPDTPNVAFDDSTDEA